MRQSLTNRQGRGAIRARFAVVLLVLAASSGCRIFGRSATFANPEDSITATLSAPGNRSVQARTAGYRGGGQYSSADALARNAVALERANQPACVDGYFAATVTAFQSLDGLGHVAGSDVSQRRAWDLYHGSLGKLIATSQRFGRFDAQRGLRIAGPGGEFFVRLDYRGFAWRPDDFNELRLVGNYQADGLPRGYRRTGLGVPLVVVRRRPCPERFHGPQQPFAATAVLVPDEAPASSGDPTRPGQSFALSFYNPAVYDGLALTSGAQTPLAGDLSAPLAWHISTHKSAALDEFLRPASGPSQMKLAMLEPYQRGKIPIVFVHGLLSEPLTWITLGNDLRSQPWFRSRYQVWAFRYATGQPFLNSALDLRRELDAAISASPAAWDDPAVSQMVLVGHSMGGLVVKLQATYSGDEIWNTVANRPLGMIIAPPAVRQQLQANFYFAPNPRVKRVIFVGTPHRGSSFASRAIGRLSASLVETNSDVNQRHAQLVAANPGVFAPWIRDRVPTSIDLLEPDSPLLAAMGRLPLAPHVHFHSIIGTGGSRWPDGAGDGVVTVESARHPRVDSELFVAARHTELHHQPETVAEFERILRLHLAEFEATSLPATPGR